MQVSAKVDYAVRAMVELATFAPDRRTRGQLADAQDIPPKYLESILGGLRQAGLLHSQRGPEGGFTLARPADEITVADIARAVDGPLTLVHGRRPETVQYEGTGAALTGLWVAVRASVRSVLEAVTVADIVAGRLPEAVQARLSDDDAWQAR